MRTRAAPAVDRIGTVVFRDGEAWLDLDGRWFSPVPDIAETLNLAFSPYRAGHAPKYGFGLASVRQAAEFLKGTATFPTPAPVAEA